MYSEKHCASTGAILYGQIRSVTAKDSVPLTDSLDLQVMLCGFVAAMLFSFTDFLHIFFFTAPQ